MATNRLLNFHFSCTSKLKERASLRSLPLFFLSKRTLLSLFFSPAFESDARLYRGRHGV